MREIINKKQIMSFLGDSFNDLLFELFDRVRLVDPVNKTVELAFKPVPLDACEVYEHDCHAVWGRGRICENCTSIIAFKTNKVISKLDTIGQEAFLVQSIPIELDNGQRFVLELMKNLSNIQIKSQNNSLSEIKSSHDDFAGLLQSISDMNQKIYHDALTTAYNREYLMVEIAERILKKSEFPLTMIMADLDRFKSINDIYGHRAGDLVLQAFVKTAQRFLRKDKDCLVRYGGDEFVIWLPNTTEIQAKMIIDRIEIAIAEHKVSVDHEMIAFSVSMGLVTINERGISFEEILKEADKAMYKKKSAKFCVLE